MEPQHQLLCPLRVLWNLLILVLLGNLCPSSNCRVVGGAGENPQRHWDDELEPYPKEVR